MTCWRYSFNVVAKSESFRTFLITWCIFTWSNTSARLVNNWLPLPRCAPFIRTEIKSVIPAPPILAITQPRRKLHVDSARPLPLGKPSKRRKKTLYKFLIIFSDEPDDMYDGELQSCGHWLKMEAAIAFCDSNPRDSLFLYTMSLCL